MGETTDRKCTSPALLAYKARLFEAQLVAVITYSSRGILPTHTHRHFHPLLHPLLCHLIPFDLSDQYKTLVLQGNRQQTNVSKRKKERKKRGQTLQSLEN